MNLTDKIIGRQIRIVNRYERKVFFFTLKWLGEGTVECSSNKKILQVRMTTVPTVSEDPPLVGMGHVKF